MTDGAKPVVSDPGGDAGGLQLLRTDKPTPQADSARVLVVDDDRITRAKLRLAVRSLGHDVEEVADGAAALARLARGGIDAVLLDIVMPEMDGYAVLRAMKADADLRDVPVIVVSGLEDDTQSVVRAIDLGAEDFLPKAFESAILKARLDASLRRKRFRDREREQARALAGLIAAAEALERDDFRPEMLAIGEAAARDDALGRFARVFEAMTREIYERERRLRRRVKALHGGLLVIAVGTLFGLSAPLARIAAQSEAPPIAATALYNLFAMTFLLGIAAARGRFRLPSRRHIGFFLVWAVAQGVLENLALYFVAAQVQAMTISLMLTLQGFITFGIAAAMQIERLSARRLAGLALGMTGAALVILSRDRFAGGESLLWLLAAASLPLLIAMEELYVAMRRPPEFDPSMSIGIMMFLSFLMTAPVAHFRGDFDALASAPSLATVAIIAMALTGGAASVLNFRVMVTAGPVFASQTAYTCAAGGIVWSMILLGEAMSVEAWAALALMFVGLYFVDPKESDGDSAFRLPLGAKRPPAERVD